MNKPSTFAKRLRELLDDTRWTQTELATRTGISKSSINHYLKGDWEGKQDAVFSIARTANVNEAWLMGYDVCKDRFGFEFSSNMTCPDCGYRYNQDDLEEVSAHAAHHRKWERAVEKFDFCWAYEHREKLKAAARNRIDGKNLSTAEHLDARLTVFKALFSRSLEANEYSLAHIDFPTYVAMLLHQEQWKTLIEPHIYNLLVEIYGTKPGIPEGTYYSVPFLPISATETPTPVSENGRLQEFLELFSQLTAEEQALIIVQIKGILSSR